MNPRKARMHSPSFQGQIYFLSDLLLDFGDSRGIYFLIRTSVCLVLLNHINPPKSQNAQIKSFVDQL